MDAYGAYVRVYVSVCVGAGQGGGSESMCDSYFRNVINVRERFYTMNFEYYRASFGVYKCACMVFLRA